MYVYKRCFDVHACLRHVEAHHSSKIIWKRYIPGHGYAIKKWSTMIYSHPISIWHICSKTPCIFNGIHIYCIIRDLKFNILIVFLLRLLLGKEIFYIKRGNKWNYKINWRLRVLIRYKMFDMCFFNRKFNIYYHSKINSYSYIK